MERVKKNRCENAHRQDDDDGAEETAGYDIARMMLVVTDSRLSAEDGHGDADELEQRS